VYGVSHHNGELFALRLLLSVVKGATSFEDLATCDGDIHTTFRSACFARGMMADDTELIATFEEIIETTVSVDLLRKYFVTMLLHGGPHDPRALFDRFVDDLSDSSDGQHHVAAALHALEDIMRSLGRSLTEKDFGFILPEIPDMPHQRKRRRRDSMTISVDASRQERDRLLQLFTAEQHDALREVVAALGTGETRASPAHFAVMCHTGSNNVFVVLASAGCGKTVFANGLAAYCRAESHTVMCVAASALAAMLLSGGSTAHSAFHLPIPCNDATTCNLTAESRAYIKRVDLIVYDECSMVHDDVASTLDRTLRDIMQNQTPFGGKVIVWMGDFKQLLPVIRYGKGHNHTIQKCAWWKTARYLTFTHNWRAHNNPEYTSFLEDVGWGRIENVTVPAACRVDSYEDLIARVYGDTWDASSMILALTLETCDIINRMCFAKLPGDLVEGLAADVYVDCIDRDSYPPDYIAALSIKGAPPWMLQLKVGAKYMCIRNLDAPRGIINGTMMRLLHIGRRYLQMQVLTGKSQGSVELIMKAKFTITPEASGLPFTMLRVQYPLIAAYCLSVHKAQGQSLLRLGIVFESDPFTHGQLYVALSRVGGWENVIAYYQGDDIRNIVLKHLLTDHSSQ